LKESAPFWSTSGDDTETPFGNIFHFPFKGLRFSMALMQMTTGRQETAHSLYSALEAAFSAVSFSCSLANLTHQPPCKNERWMNREGRLG